MVGVGEKEKRKEGGKLPTGILPIKLMSVLALAERLAGSVNVERRLIVKVKSGEGQCVQERIRETDLRP